MTHKDLRELVSGDIIADQLGSNQLNGQLAKVIEQGPDYTAVEITYGVDYGHVMHLWRDGLLDKVHVIGRAVHVEE
jgi:hypothetical protein